MNCYRPTFVLPKQPIYLTKNMETHRVLKHLQNGQDLILTDNIQTGLHILKYLQDQEQKQQATYQERKASHKQFLRYAKHILVSIKNNHVVLQKKTPLPQIFELLYHDIPEQIFLSLLDFQHLHQDSQRFEEGIFYSVLGHKIHPFFGVYAPTRTSHLELFATWLQKYEGSMECTYDIGAGSGILSFLLAKRGFQKIIATDNNPNAIISIQGDIDRIKQERLYAQNISCFYGDLFAEQRETADVIVCNPPWMLGEITNTIDAAMFFEDGFFERFFEQAHILLKKEGRIVLIFSNVIDLVTPDVGHPIQKELEGQRFFLVQKMQRKVQATKENGHRKRRRTKEKVEVWELQKRT